MPKGNYVIIKGNKADANADFLRAGYEEVIGDAVKSGDIKIVGETYTDNWDPAKAQTEMEQFLTADNNDVQAVLSENDGMAGGVVAALEAQGLAGKVPVSGQDGDQAALNRVALGTQTVDVWKDARVLGKAAGEAAVQLCKDKDVTKVTGTAAFTTPGGNDAVVDPPDAAADHQGQPQRRDRRRLDHQGQRLQGRHRRLGRGLRLTGSTTVPLGSRARTGSQTTDGMTRGTDDNGGDTEPVGVDEHDAPAGAVVALGAGRRPRSTPACSAWSSPSPPSGSPSTSCRTATS